MFDGSFFEIQIYVVVFSSFDTDNGNAKTVKPRAPATRQCVRPIHSCTMLTQTTKIEGLDGKSNP